jgi:hypothetical protein
LNFNPAPCANPTRLQDEQFKIIEDVTGDVAAAKAELEDALQELRKAEELRNEALEVLRTVCFCSNTQSLKRWVR